MATVSWPWAIILCRFADVTTTPRPRQYYVDLFAAAGMGGVADYWRDVTGNSLDVTGSRVFGWFDMPQTRAEMLALAFPGQRDLLVQWGVAAATANSINLGAFRSILVVQNDGVDHGATGPQRVVIVHADPDLCEFGFICHEMGHGMGLPHSWAANPDFEYGDGWDVMSLATSTFHFSIDFQGARGLATGGLNARNLEALGALPAGRIWEPAGPDFSQSITLDAVGQPPIGNHGPLVVRIPPHATSPARKTNSTFTIEHHQQAGWDRAIPEDSISVREIRANGTSYLQPTRSSRFVAGETFTTPDPKVFMRVAAIDPVRGTADIRVWDLPDRSLRKEDSKARVYLIEQGTKRWVTSPSALATLGKNFTDVRSVPDGALSSVPDGPDFTGTPVDSDLHVCAVDDGGRLLHTIRFPGSWQPVGEVETQTGDMGVVRSVSCATVGSDLHVSAVDDGGRLLHTIRFPGSWQPVGEVETQTGDMGVVRSVSCAAVGSDLHVCAVDDGGRLLHTIRFPGSWQPVGEVETQTGDMGVVRSVSCAAVGSDLHVCTVDDGGRLLHTIRFPGSWQPVGEVETQTGDMGVVRSVSCAAVGSDLHVCAVDDGGRLLHTIRFPGSWQPVGEVETQTGDMGVVRSVSCATVGSDLHVCAVDDGGRLLHTIRFPGSWQPVGEVETQTGDMGVVRSVSCAKGLSSGTIRGA